MKINFEYYLFSKEDPIASLKDYAKDLTLSQKRKVSPYIRRAEGTTKTIKKFRDFLMDDNLLSDVIGSAFMLYFDTYIDKRKYLCIPRDAAHDFSKYWESIVTKSDEADAKYMKKVNSVMSSNIKFIDPFIKAFLSIRIAQLEIAKFK